MESEDEDAIEKEAVQEILSEVKEKDEQTKQAVVTATTTTMMMAAATTTSPPLNKIFPTTTTINKRLYFRNLVSTLREPLDVGASRKRKIVGLDCNLSEEEAEEKRSKWQSRKLIKGKDYDPDTEYIYDARMYFDPEKAKETQEYRNARKDIIEQSHQFGGFEPFPAGLWRGQRVVRGRFLGRRAFPTRGFFTRGRFLKSGRFLQRCHAMPRGYPVSQYPSLISAYGRPYGPWVAPQLQDLPYHDGGDDMIPTEGQSVNNNNIDSYISSDDYKEQFMPATTLETKSKKKTRRLSCSSSDIIFRNASASIAGENEGHSLNVSSDKRTKSKKKNKRVRKKHKRGSREIKCKIHSGPEEMKSPVNSSCYHPTGSDCRETSDNKWCHDRFSCEADDFSASCRRSSVSENLRMHSDKEENAGACRSLLEANDGFESDNEINAHKSEYLKYKSGSIKLRTKKKNAKRQDKYESKKKRKVKDLDDEEKILIEEGKRLQEVIEQTTRLLYGLGNSEKYSVIRHYAKSYFQNTDTDDRLKVFLSRKIRRSCSELNLFYCCPVLVNDNKSKDDMSLISAVKNIESDCIEFRKKYRINRIIKQVSETSSSSDESHDGELAYSMMDFDVSDLNSLRGRLLKAVNDKNTDTSLSSRESGSSVKSWKAKYSFSPEVMALESSLSYDKVMALESNLSRQNHSGSSGAEIIYDEDVGSGHENSPRQRVLNRTSQRSDQLLCDEVGRTSYENLQIMIKNTPAHYSHRSSLVKYPDEYKSLKDGFGSSKDSVDLGWNHRSREESRNSEKGVSAYSYNRSMNYHASHDKRRLGNGASFGSNSYSRSNDIPVHRHQLNDEHLSYYGDVHRSKKTYKSFPICSKSYNDQSKSYVSQRHDDRRYDDLNKGRQIYDMGLHSSYDISDRERLFEDVDNSRMHWENRGLYVMDHSTRLEGSSWKADSRTASSFVSMKRSREEPQNSKRPGVSQHSDRTHGRQDLQNEKNTKFFHKISRDERLRPEKSNYGTSRHLESKNRYLPERSRRESKNSRSDKAGSVTRHNHRSQERSAIQRKKPYNSRDKSTSCDSPCKPVNRSVLSTVAVIVKPGVRSEGANKDVRSSKLVDSEKTDHRDYSRVPSLTSYRSDKRRN